LSRTLADFRLLRILMTGVLVRERWAAEARRGR
jgi:hypothetical protein